MSKMMTGPRILAVLRPGLFIAATVAAMAVPAAGPASTARELLTSRLQGMGRDSTEWKALLVSGKERTEFCARCHGEDGNSKEPLVPNLAAQNPYYLLDQTERFADGRRKDFIMSPLARQYSHEDRVIVAIYYSAMKARSQSADPALAAQGAALYGQRCIACHGQGALGNDQFARLAGQHPAYIKRRLEGFQGVPAASASPMTEIARMLNNTQIAQLAAYLSSLP